MRTRKDIKRNLTHSRRSKTRGESRCFAVDSSFGLRIRLESLRDRLGDFRDPDENLCGSGGASCRPTLIALTEPDSGGCAAGLSHERRHRDSDVRTSMAGPCMASLFRPADVFEQLEESGIVAYRVELRIDQQPDHMLIAHLSPLFEPCEGLVVFAESDVDESKTVWGRWVRLPIHQFLKDPAGLDFLSHLGK